MKKWSDFNIDTPEQGTGHKYVLCPVCSEHRKKRKLRSLGVTYENNAYSWACNHCGFSGSLYRGILNQGDVNRLSKGNSSGRPQSKDFVKPKFEPPTTEYHKEFLEYFKKRGISKTTLERNSIKAGKNKFSSREDPEEMIRCIQFPFYKMEEVVNVKWRGFEEKVFKQSYKAEKTVYGYDDIYGKRIVVITEGEFDKLSVDESLTNEYAEMGCCSVPDGAPHPKTKDYTSKFDYMQTIEEILNKAEIVILATDDDEAGYKLREELARRIGKEKCRIVNYPEDCNDMNEVLVNHGKEGVLEVLDNASSYPIVGIFTLTDVEDQVNRIFEQGVTPGMELPWNNCKDLFRVALGEFTTVTGVPQSGKSEFLDSIAVHLAKKYQKRIGLFSPEHPMHLHIIRLAEKIVNKPVFINYNTGLPIDRGPKYMTSDEFHEAKLFINKYFFWIKKERGQVITLPILHDKKRSLILRHGVEIFIDDPYNKMDHARPRDQNETDYISWFLDMYGEFNEDNNTHSFLAAHPTLSKLKKVKKTIEGKTHEVWPVVTAADISGSSHWWNKSLNVLSVYRPGMNLGTEAGRDVPTTIYTQKVKWKWNGQLSCRDLYFNSNTGNYTESLNGAVSFKIVPESSDSDDLPF